jgi:hypothetical protein
MKLLTFLVPIFFSGCSWLGISLWNNEPEPEEEPVLLIFGGEGYSDYLGCLNCPPEDSDSVLNPYGAYGSEYSAYSVYNKSGLFGSEESPYSPCNKYATNPPIVVDNQGKFYGYLTINRSSLDGDIIYWLVYDVCK